MKYLKRNVLHVQGAAAYPIPEEHEPGEEKEEEDEDTAGPQ